MPSYCFMNLDYFLIKKKNNITPMIAFLKFKNM